MEIRSIIIDDELQARKNLRYLLQNFIPEVCISGEYCSVQKVIKSISDLNLDLIFLDIQMPELNGFDFLEIIGSDRQFEIIFVTAHNNYGIEAVKAGALDYILKPISISELRKAIDKFKNKKVVNKIINNYNIRLPQFNGFVLVDSREIVRLEADNNYSKVFMNSGKQYYISKTLKEFELILNSEVFLRIHKSNIINLSYFKEFENIDGGYARLKDNSKICVSRRKIVALKDAIKKISMQIEKSN